MTAAATAATGRDRRSAGRPSTQAVQPAVDQEERDRRRRRQDQPRPVAHVHPSARRAPPPISRRVNQRASAISVGSTRTGCAGSARGQEAQHQRAGERPGLAAHVPRCASTPTPTSSRDLAQHGRLGRLARLDEAGQAGEAAHAAGLPARRRCCRAGSARPGPATPSCTSTIIAGSVRGQIRPPVVGPPGTSRASPTAVGCAGARRVAVPGVPVGQRHARW